MGYASITTAAKCLLKAQGLAFLPLLLQRGVRIAGCGRELTMTEEPLDGQEIDAILQQVCRARVPEPVGIQMHADTPAEIAEFLIHAVARELLPALREGVVAGGMGAGVEAHEQILRQQNLAIGFLLGVSESKEALLPVNIPVFQLTEVARPAAREVEEGDHGQPERRGVVEDLLNAATADDLGGALGQRDPGQGVDGIGRAPAPREGRPEDGAENAPAAEDRRLGQRGSHVEIGRAPRLNSSHT